MERGKMAPEDREHGERETSAEVSVEISVVVPVSERHDNLRDLYTQYSRELSIYGCPYEFIFVLDGPQDEALQALKQLKKEYQHIKVIALNRWFGEATALAVGFEHASGAIILTLSSYFQVEPHEVHRMLKKLVADKYDLVISRRCPRIDSLFNRVQSWVFHRLTQMLTGMKYHDISCGLRAMKRKVTREIRLYGDLHRFIPLLAYQQGFKIAEVPVQQSPHDLKRRIYTPGVYLRRLLDILTLFFLFKFTKKPLRFFGLVGSGLFGAGALITGYLGVYRLLRLGAIADRPLLMLGILLMVLGVQLFSIGLLGEIIIFTHARDTKDYQVEEILD